MYTSPQKRLLKEMNYLQRLKLAGIQHKTRDMAAKILEKEAKKRGICPRCLKTTKPDDAKYAHACKCPKQQPPQ